MSDGASLGTARGTITIDSSQALGSLNSLGGALDNFNSRTQSLSGTTNQFAQSTVGLAQGMQNVGNAMERAGQAAAAPFVDAAKSALTFESEMANTNAVMDVSASQFQDLSDLALQLGKDTIFTANETAQGITELGRAGISYEDIMSGAAAAATDLAGAGGVDVPKAADVMSAAMAAFNITGAESVQIADALAGAANFSLTDINQLGIGLGQVGGIADAANMSMQDTVAFLALMADNGVKGSDAATSMKTALLKLLSPTDTAAAKMQELGVNLLDTQGNFVGLGDASQQFFDAWKSSGQTMSEFLAPLGDVFGSDAIRAILFGMQAIEADQTGIGKGWKDYQAATNDAGAANDFMKAKMDSTAGSIEFLQGSLDALRVKMGTPLIEGIRGPIDALTQFVNALTNIPGPVLGAITIVGALAAGILTAGGAFLVIGGYILEAVARFQAIGIGMDVIVGTATRLTLALTGVGLVVAAVALAINTNFLGARDAIQAVLDLIDAAIQKFQLFFNIGKAEAGDQGPQGKGFFSDLAKNISAVGRAVDAVLGTNLSGFFDQLAGGADVLERWRVGLSHAADMMKIYTDDSKRTTATGKTIEAMGKTLDKIFGTNVSGAFRTAAIGIDAFGHAMEIFAADGTLSGLPALLESVSVGLEAAFGSNAVSDVLSNLSANVKSVQDAFASAESNGLNPFEAAMRALGVAAQIAGFNGLADAIDSGTNTAIKFGNAFQAAQDAIAGRGIVGLPNAILAINDAMLATIGIGLPDFMIGAANAMAAFQTAMSNGLEQGLNPLQAGLKGLGAAIGSIFGTDARNQFFAFVDAMGQLGGAVQSAIAQGLGRVGQMFSEIGSALSTGDISGALDAVGSLVADVGAALQAAGQKALDWAINVGEPALAGWAKDQAGKFGEWLKGKITGFGDLAGQTLANIQGWFMEVGAPQLTGWVEGGAALIGPELQKAVQFAGDTLAKLAGWFLEVGAPQLKGWVEGGAALIGPEIQKALNFAGETLGKIAGWIAEVGAPQLDGWVRDAKGAIGTAIQGYMPTAGEKLGDVKSWILEVGIPTVQAVAGFVGGIADQITGLISDPAIVASAEAAGKAAGTTIGQKLGSALATALVSALDGALGGTGSQAHGADAGAGGGSSITASASKAAGNIFDGFGDAFAKAAIEAFGKEMAKAKEQIITGVQAAFVQAVSDILNTPLVPNATNNPVTTGAAGGNAVNDFVVEKLGLGPNSNIGQFILDQANASKAANQAAAQEATKVGVVDPAIAGAQQATGSPLDAIGALKDSALGTILDLKNFIDPTQQGAAASANAATATDAVTQSIVDPFHEAIDGFPSLLRDMVANEGPASQEAISSGVQDMSLGTALDQTMATQIGDVSLDTFSAAMGQKIGEAVLAGMTNATTANVGGSGGGTAAGGIGQSIVGALTTSLQTTDFAPVGTAISTQIGTALSTGFTQAEATGPSTAGIDIGSQIALSLASAITGSDFSVVSQAIQQKIGQSLSGGTGGTAPAADTSAVAGEGATIGASIAASLANAILTSDFAVVGQAIQQKISQAVASASSGATTGGAGAGLGGVVGQGSGMASGIVASIVASFASADFSGIGTAVSAKVSAAITAGMQGANVALVNAMGTLIQNGMVAAESSNEIGNVFSEAVAGAITSTSGTIDMAASTSITTAVTAAQAIASAAGPVGTAFTVAVGAGIGGGTATVTGAADAMVQAAIAAGSGTAAGASAVGTAFDTAVGGGIGAGAGTVTAAATAVMASASAAAQGAAAASGGAIGAAFDQGIASGIGANAGVVTAAAAAVVNSAVAAAQSAAETGSPSKRTEREVGEPLIQGMVVGIEKNAPLLNKAIERSVNDAIKSVKKLKPVMDEINALGEHFGAMPGLSEIGSQLTSVAGNIGSTVDSVKSNMKDVLKSVQDSLKSGKDKVKSSADAVAGAATGSFNDIIKKRKDLLKSGKKDVKGNLFDLKGLDSDIASMRRSAAELGGETGPNDFAQRINDMANSLEGSRDDAVKAAEDLLSRIDDALNKAKNTKRKQGKDIADEVTGGMSDGFTADTSTATSTADTLSSSIVDTINANLSRLPEMATKIGEAIPTSLGAGIDSNAGVVSDAVNTLGTDVSGGLDAAVPAMENSAETASSKFITALTSAIDAQIGTVGTSGEGVGTALSDGTTATIADSPIRTAVSDFVTGLTSEIQSKIGTVQNAGASIGTSLTTGMNSKTADVKTAGSSLTDTAVDGVTSAVPKAENTGTTAGSDVGTSVLNGLQDACKPVNTAGNDLTSTCVPDGIDAGLPTATKSAKDAGQGISDALSGGLDLRKGAVKNNFGKAGTDFGAELAKSIAAKNNDAKTSSQGLIDNAGTVSGTNKGQGVGQSFADGLIKGIDNTANQQDVGTAAANLIDAAERAANAAAGNNSPSKLFMEVGLNLMKGLENGIRDGTTGAVNAMSESAQTLGALFAGTGFDQASHLLDLQLKNYTGSVDAALKDMDRIASKSDIVMKLTPGNSGADRPNATPTTGGEKKVDNSVTINGLVVPKGTPLEKAVLDMASHLRSTSGQYESVR